MVEEEIKTPDAGEEGEGEVLVRPTKAPVPELVVKPSETLKTIAAALDRLRADRPLVACLTNFVTAPFVADGVFALGASPFVVMDSGEATTLATKCGALLLNVGTVDRAQGEAMRAAVARANAGAHPWVLDPEGVGALPMRTYLARELMRRFPAVIRGNASEILVLAGVPGAENGGLGVESTAKPEDVLAEARRLAQVTHAAVVVSGKVQYVCGENAPVVAVMNGEAQMARISGTGCLHAAVAAAFLAALGSKERFTAALAASLVCGLAGERAASAKGPGSFKVAFLDALNALTGADITKSGKLEVVK